MKICVLEWICGGGMLTVPAGEIPNSLQSEGRAMLSTLIRTFEHIGAEVTTAVDDRFDLMLPLKASEVTDVGETTHLVDRLVPAPWITLAQDADFAMVVAPEIDGALTRVVDLLRRSNVGLLNCDGAFLANASDKLKTSRCLRAAGISHPATVALAELDPRELSGQGQRQWIVKPRMGAGCEQFAFVEGSQLSSLMPQRLADGFLAQPVLPGSAYSCSAIVDREGYANWMPLVTQELTHDYKYRGGCLANPKLQARRPKALLDETIAALGDGALGWVGIDLLLGQNREEWTVIEVNPRATTSIIGLAAASNYAIGQQLWEAYFGRCDARIEDWSAVKFSADGQVIERGTPLA